MVSFADWRAAMVAAWGPYSATVCRPRSRHRRYTTRSPWRFRAHADGVDVFADHTRRLGVVDPSGREVLISVGAALLNLRIAWPTAGQALERALLTATVRGVATTVIAQPMEIPQLRELLVDSAASLVPQVIVRFGYGPPSAPTPRRTLEEVVDWMGASSVPARVGPAVGPR